MALTRAAVVALGAIMTLATPCRAQAPDVSAEARTRYARGVQLYDEGSYGAALVELQRANELSPSSKLLYNIGLVQVQLGEFVGALRSFEAYLTAGGAEVPAARRAEVDERIAGLRGRIATLQIQVSVADAEITVDDIVVGTSPLAGSIQVNPGRHKVAARKAGHRPDVLSIAVAARDHVAVALEPAPEVTPPPPPAPVPVVTAPPPPALDAADARKGRSSALVTASWITTGALAAGAVVTGALALSASADLDAQKTGTATPGAELDAMAARARTFALATDVFLVGTVVAGGVSIYLTLSRGGAPKTAHGFHLGVAHVAWSGEF